MKSSYETFQNYVLLERLASGGMAEVYLAKKMAARGVQKFVAVKRILEQFSSSEDFIKMFQDEAQIAINLSHGNVVSIYDFGLHQGQFFIVMEFVEGRNLREIMNRLEGAGESLSISYIVNIIKQVSAGLDYAHNCIDPKTGQSLNIIHRDVSPQNVMISFSGQCKIVDFGIAKATNQMEVTQGGALKGKFGYMSPEQVESQSIDKRSDIFALGIMCWEMLAGQRLFLSNSEMKTLVKIRECQIPDLREINPKVPTELNRIIQKALQKNRHQRYGSAAELNRDLQSFISRFDPDFSIQDFANFIKNFFSEEIVEIRKKQISYSKVKIQPENENKTEIISLQSKDNLPQEKVQSKFQNFDLEKIKEKKDSKLETVANLDFSQATMKSDKKVKKSKIGKIRDKAHKDAESYKKNTFTNISAVNSLPNKKKILSSSLPTFLFGLSFVFITALTIAQRKTGVTESICKILPFFKCESQLSETKFSSKIWVYSVPNKAKVYLNKKFMGETPISISPQKYPFKLSLRKLHYHHQKHIFTKKPSSSKLTFNLRHFKPSFLEVKSIGSYIYVNGRKVNSGQKVQVPSQSRIHIKVKNPRNGRTKAEYRVLKPGRYLTVIIPPP